MHILALIAALLFAAPVANPSATLRASPTPEQCEAIHALVGGELVAWDSASYSWPDLPDDLERTGRVDFASGGVWKRHSKSERASYIWVFLSYTIDGSPRGAHDFCGPYKVADA